MTRKSRTRRWFREHSRDEFVKKARSAGYRSRAAYKLIALDERDRLLRPGLVVVDLGAAPGGWSQVAADRVGAQGRVYALDILEMEPIQGVGVVQGDMRDAGVRGQLRAELSGRAVDLVISDMAPNLTGVKITDEARATELGEAVIEFAEAVLSGRGALVMKVFQGAGFDHLRAHARANFATVAVRKPGASRQSSAETYLVARR